MDHHVVAMQRKISGIISGGCVALQMLLARSLSFRGLIITLYEPPFRRDFFNIHLFQIDRFSKQQFFSLFQFILLNSYAFPQCSCMATEKHMMGHTSLLNEHNKIKNRRHLYFTNAHIQCQDYLMLLAYS
mmetsp:Transcript_26826/g.35709  ORF Transcript_26826/g.35709 Transcript_26826/m.35709 type:complete len:130 (+) Transcript_26826:759-1148(+)